MIACPGCGAALTGVDQAVTIDGRAVGEYANAAGVGFRVRFYARAEGCAAAGPATDEATWFEGHTWQRAYCRACSRHAGWLFRHKARAFWALIDL